MKKLVIQVPDDLFEEIKRRASKKYGDLRGALSAYVCDVLRREMEECPLSRLLERLDKLIALLEERAS